MQNVFVKFTAPSKKLTVLIILNLLSYKKQYVHETIFRKKFRLTQAC